ncbi:MAG TPA: sugar ABC transporter substrate-binding protein [Atribacter sp.]|jgi:ribose transport system substrate-binding protein|uniref:D-ribose-binding periplasmic protein n=1 Tax=Candidatus Atribacter allofermentans TaxID=1852833 RepID=A0A1V5SJD6_9BACT|nr:sugar ABC transporter substrate-binding protein [Atribacter sp.]MDD3714148.1 sugar ABC transporter substrate-binding protein [Atribacterota bacterium]OQA54666.1 MAG: D-ribose-binding periplasmic protein precursor [Candidatus Atribacteria bacterium ADurb.Bin276]HHT09170.1 sugar ABC transporter substrate-binding protein [Candidatus Atribacteria bacterium]MDI9594706.1 sugar ABC transporter substrate-binding protein [Atribacterota bacterium]HQK82645.1 sugar ABC transporter substrate-binding pro
MKKLLSLIIIFGILSLSFCAIAQEEPVYLGTAIRSLSNPYHAVWADGATAFANSLGWKDYNVIQTCEGSSEKQLNDIKALVARSQGNVVFSIDPNQSTDAPAIANELEKSSVYFITWWNKPDDVSVADYKYWVCHITFDNRASGYNTAKAIFDAVGGSGKVFALQGLLGNSAAIERWEGFEKALTEYPEIELVGWQAADWEKVKAYNHVSNALIADPDIKAIWCANDSMAIGALEALRARELVGKVPVSGVDAIPEMITAIKNKEAIATVASDAFWQGGMGLSIPLAVKQGKIKMEELPENKREWIAQTILITQENIDWYIENYVEGTPEYNWNDYWGKWVRGIKE